MAVYCIADVAKTVLKVGFTKDKQSADSRMKSLQTSCPYRLHLLAFCPHMTMRDEKYIHDSIKEYRLDGGTEWFSFDAITIVSAYMKFDPEKIEPPKQTTRLMTQPKPVQRVIIEPDFEENSTTAWTELGITEGKEPYYSDDENDEQGDSDDTDFCQVLDESITKYAHRNGVLPEWLNWPDSHFGQLPEFYRKFLPMGYQLITYSQLAKHLVLGTQGEGWNPSEVMAKVVAHELCSAHFWPESGDDEIQAYPLFNKDNPQLLLMMCFAEPKDTIDEIEVFINEFFWTLDSYIMGMSFLIIDKMHNYYEATHSHPLTQLTRQEINRLRFGDMATT